MVTHLAISLAASADFYNYFLSLTQSFPMGNENQCSPCLLGELFLHQGKWTGSGLVGTPRMHRLQAQTSMPEQLYTRSWIVKEHSCLEQGSAVLHMLHHGSGDSEKTPEKLSHGKLDPESSPS